MIKELFNLEVSPCCLQKTLRTFTGHRSSGVEQQFRKLQVRVQFRSVAPDN